jgi:hypothetical protein
MFVVNKGIGDVVKVSGLACDTGFAGGTGNAIPN